MSEVRAAQARALDCLKARFGSDCVNEWTAFRRTTHYGPRPDLAVGPFAVDDLRLDATYNAMSRQHRELLNQLWRCHSGNVGQPALGEQTLHRALAANGNARCFLAIEIENEVSRKHLIGGIVNAVALGKIGIVVGWSEEKLNALLRIRLYLRFLAGAGKPSVAFDNLLILTRPQFESVLAVS